MLIVEPFSRPTRYAHQPCHRLFGHLHEPGCGPHATAFTEMADDILGFRLRELGVEQGGTASLGEFFPTGATTQQADAIVLIDLTHSEIGLARAAKQVA